ncbi:hypothetical protein [Methylocystis sp. S23]
MGYYVKQESVAGVQKTVEEYVIASVRCRRTTTERGRLIIEDDTLAWLSEDVRGNPKATTYKDDAKRFRTRAEAEAWAPRCERQPWWYAFKDGTLRVYRVTRTVTVREVEI